MSFLLLPLALLLASTFTKAQFTTDPRVDQNDADYYIGYKGSDYDTPWAKYYNDSLIVLSDELLQGLETSPKSPDLGVPIDQGGEALNQPGYLALENGYTLLDDGTLYLTIRTDVPSNFTGEMFDFWFSWHTNDTTKYKLWNPGQHEYAALTQQEVNTEASKTTYREKYWNITSFVDEYIGGTAYKLSIAFFEPRLLGFSIENPATGVQTITSAFVQIFVYNQEQPATMAQQGFQPLDVVLVHQVREKPDGTGNEIRSRFWFGPALVAAMRLIMDPYQLGHDLSVHTANEMTHLGTFLPALFEEFRDNTST